MSMENKEEKNEMPKLIFDGRDEVTRMSDAFYSLYPKNSGVSKRWNTTPLITISEHGRFIHFQADPEIKYANNDAQHLAFQGMLNPPETPDIREPYTL